MKHVQFLILTAALSLSDLAAAQVPFESFINHGLVGVGRLPAASFDKAGDGKQDTLGGFSALAVDQESLVYTDGKISGTLFGLPDRGFGDGSSDYHPRIEVFRFSIKPYFGTTTVGQDQIAFTNIETRLLIDDHGNTFTGFDAGSTNHPGAPQSSPSSIGRGRLSLDPEGLARLADGSFWISDEYGPLLLHFNSAGELQETVSPPKALVPTVGNFPGTLNFTAVSPPTSGRRNNRGLEGLSLTPDGKRLIAFLQSPTMQDAGAGNLGRNTRILQFDADSRSATYGRLVAEHIYQLTMNGSPERDRHTLVSEVLALDKTTFLALERDSHGYGSETNLAPLYKRVVLCSTLGATDIASSGCDLEKGAPGQISLPAGDLPSNLKPVVRKDFVDILDTTQLAKFGLNTHSDADTNTIAEKWEALALIPMNKASDRNDYLLLVGNDNDFKAPITYHNGSAIKTNKIAVDLMLLAYHISLPNSGHH